MESVPPNAEQVVPERKEEELKAAEDSLKEKDGAKVPKGVEQKQATEEKDKGKEQETKELTEAKGAEKDPEKEAAKEPKKEEAKEAEKEEAKEAEKEKEKETEQEKFVLRRKAKSTGEAMVVEHPPVILLTKKALQEEGQMKDKPIEIEEDEENAEEAAKRNDKGKEKAPEQGQEMVQLQAGTSSLTPGRTPGSSKAREMEGDKSSEDEDEIQNHLCTMLKAMQKIDKVNEERNAKFDNLMQISLTQQQTNVKQLQYIEDLLMREALKESLYEAEQKRSEELSKRLNQAQQRYIKAEKELEESKEELALQKLQNEQMKIALQVANKRRTVGEEELDRLLTNPILSSVKPSTSFEAVQKEHLALTELLKEKERQLSLVTSMFLQKEQELQSQIKVLQAKLDDAQRAAVLKEQMQIEMPP